MRWYINYSNKLILRLISPSSYFSLITGGSYKKSPSNIILNGLRNIIWDILYYGILAASSIIITGDMFCYYIKVLKCLSIIVVVDSNNLELIRRWVSSALNEIKTLDS